MAEKRKISLVLADVDGTLVTEQKVLTKRAQAAVHSLRGAGIRFAVTSGRPAKGMAMLVDPLQIDTPIAGFNGGLVVKPDFTIIDQKTVPADVAARSVELLRAHGWTLPRPIILRSSTGWSARPMGRTSSTRPGP